MWFDWKKNAVYQVLSLDHVRAPPSLSSTLYPCPSSCRPLGLIRVCQVAVSMDACPAGNLVAIGTRDRVIKLIDFQHATLQVDASLARLSVLAV
jgi:hypothetical protein